MQRKIPIFYGALLLTGVNLLLRLISTSFQVFLSGRIGPAGIGLNQLVMSLGALTITAGMAGIRTATMYLCAEELGRKRPENVRWVLSACILYSILISSTVALTLYFLAPFLAENWIGDIRTADALRLYSCFVPAFCLCGVMTGYFTAANRIGTLALVEVAEQLISMAITILLLTLWAGSDPVQACQSLILGNGLGGLLTLCCLVILRAREGKISSRRIPMVKRLVHTAVPLGIADDIKAGINTTENLMVPKRLALYPSTQAPLAAFGMVCGMVFPVLMFPAAILFSLAELLIPELARCAAAKSHTRIRYLVKQGLRVALLYGCLFCGLEFLSAEALGIRLYSNTEAGDHLRLYSLLIPMLYCDALTDAMTKGLGQQTACVRYNILTSSLDVIFLYLLLPRYGMKGYFVSFLVTHLLNFVLSLRRLLKIAGNVISLTDITRTLIATAVSIALAATLGNTALRIGAFTALYCCILCLFGVLGRQDLSWISKLIKDKR